MLTFIKRIVLYIVVVSFLVTNYAHADEISPFSLGASYGELSVTGLQLVSSAGEPFVGSMTTTGNQITSGYLACIRTAILNEVPKITSDTVVNTRINEVFQYKATATDRESTVSVTFLRWPSWMSITPPFITGTPTNKNGDTIFQVVAIDAGGVSDTATVRVVVLTINTPVTITSPKAITTTEHQRFSYLATVRDPLTLQTVSYSNFPSWMQVSRDSISGIPPEGAKDTSFKVIATGASSSDIITVAVTVIPVNDPPVITSDAVKGVVTNTLFDYTAVASDPEGSPVTLGFTGLPSWLSAAGSRVTGTPPSGAIDTSFTIIATDGIMQSVKLVDVRVQQVNTAPSITSLLSVSATQHRYFSYRITATDLESAPTDLAITVTSVLPSWLTFKGDSVFGTPHSKGVGTVSVIVKVTDGFTPVSKTVTVTVADSNATPVITRLADTTCSPLKELLIQVNASDLDTGRLTYGLVVAPSSMTIDSLSGWIRWLSTNADTGYKVVVVVAKDRDGAVAKDTFNVRATIDPRPRCVLDSLAQYQQGIVSIPFKLTDATNDSISLSLWYRLSAGTPWIQSTAVRNVTKLDVSKYVGVLIWTTTAEEALFNVRRDSVWVWIKPSDNGGAGLGDSTPLAKPFVLDNTPSLIIGAPIPAAGTHLPAYTTPVFTIKPKQGKFDVSTVSDLSGNVSVTGDHQGPVAVKIQCDSVLTIVPNNPLEAGNTFTILLSGKIKDSFGKYLDGNGDSLVTLTGTESVSFKFTTGYLGDFTGNDTVDILDLVKASSYWLRSAKKGWKATDSIIEAGPVVGATPYLVLAPDSVFNYLDLNTFLRMWYYTESLVPKTVQGSLPKKLADSGDDLVSDGTIEAGYGYSYASQKTPALSKEKSIYQRWALCLDTTNKAPSLKLKLSVEGIAKLTACRYRVWGIREITSVKTNESLLEKEASTLVLSRFGTSWNEANIARFSSTDASVSGSGTVATLELVPQNSKGSKLTLEYELFDEQGITIESGVVDLGMSPELVNLSEQKPQIHSQMRSAPNPFSCGKRMVPLEIVNRKEAVQWVISDNAGAVIQFALKATPGQKELLCGLTIRNLQGQLVNHAPQTDVINSVLESDNETLFTIYWNGTDINGNCVPQGVYKVCLTLYDEASKTKQEFSVGVK